MIRILPKKEDGKGFDPFASSIFSLKSHAALSGFVGGTISFKGRSTSFRGFDWLDSGFSFDEKLAFLRGEEEVSLILFKDDGTSTSFIVNYRPVLLTDAPLYKDVDGLTNCDRPGDEACALEALKPAYSFFSIKNGEKRTANRCDLRPFYAVVCAEFDPAGVITLLGPVPDEWSAVYLDSAFSVKVDGDQIMRVYTTDNEIGGALDLDAAAEEPGFLADSASADASEDLVYAEPWYFEAPGLDKIEFVLCQNPTLIDGKPLDMVSYLQAIKTRCAIEFAEASSEGSSTLPVIAVTKTFLLKDAGSSWELSDGDRATYQKFARDNRHIRDLFANISADEKNLFFTDAKGNIARIASSSGSSACLALSMAYLYGTRGELKPRLIDHVAALSSIVRSQAVTVQEGILTGTGNFSDLPIDSAQGPIVSSRVELSAVPDDDGLMILGWDPKSENSQPGTSDHYAVVAAIGKRLYALYDPYRVGPYLRAGSDVTSLYPGRETRLLAFVKEE